MDKYTARTIRHAIAEAMAAHQKEWTGLDDSIVGDALNTVSLPNQAGQLAELIARVHTFADQLLAWGYKDIALQVLTEILVGPVVTDGAYATLEETRADLSEATRQLDETRTALEGQSREVATLRAHMEEMRKVLELERQVSNRMRAALDTIEAKAHLAGLVEFARLAARGLGEAE